MAISCIFGVESQKPAWQRRLDSMIAVGLKRANKWAGQAAHRPDLTGVDATFWIAYPSSQHHLQGLEKCMLKRIVIAVAAVFCTLFVAFVSLCVWASFYGENSTSCQLASGRQIVCRARGIYVGLETHEDTAIIRTMTRTVSILPTSLQVDGRNVAAIPKTTKKVDVKVDGSVVSFVADGQTIDTRLR
jgi:hypothetical protein